jgi:hypothetical protein
LVTVEVVCSQAGNCLHIAGIQRKHLQQNIVLRYNRSCSTTALMLRPCCANQAFSLTHDPHTSLMYH